MRRADSCPQTRERAADLEQTRVVQRRADLGARVENAPHLVGEDRLGRLGVLDREGPTEAAALGAPWKVDQIEPADRSEQPPRRISDA